MFFLTFTFFFSIAEAESLLSAISQKTFETVVGEACRESDAQEIRCLNSSMSPDCACNPNAESAPMSSKQMNLDEISERTFFKFAAEKEIERMRCSNKEIDNIKHNGDIQKVILTDISEKVGPLKDLKKEYLVAKRTEIDFGTKLARVMSGLKKESLIQMQQEFRSYQEKTQKIRAAMDSIYSSIWEGNNPNMRAFVDRQVDNSKFDKDSFVQLASGERSQDSLSAVQSKMKKEIQENLGSLIKNYTNDNYSDGLKRTLFKDANLGYEILKQNPSNAKALSGLYCRLDGRYGKGRDYLNNIFNGVMMGASIVGPGALYFAAGKGLISLGSAKVLSATAAIGLTSAQSIKVYKESCEGDLLNTVVDNNSCQPTDSKSFTTKVERSNCALDLALSSLNLVGWGVVSNSKYARGLGTAAKEAANSPKAFSMGNFSSSFLKDPRFGMLGVAKSSSTGRKVDNLTSPGTQELIFHRKLTPQSIEQLKTTSSSVKVRPETIQRLELDPSEVSLLETLTSRSVTAIEIQNAAYKAKFGKDLVGSKEKTEAVKSMVAKTLEELSGSGKNKRLQELAEEVRKLKGSELGMDASKEVAIARGEFQKEFLEAIPEVSSVERSLDLTSDYLEKALADLPAGIAYRTRELTSTVRYGENNFYGNWNSYTSTTNAAYERGAKNLGGLVEADLNLTNEAKKTLAINLDRTHKELDKLYSLDKACDRHFNTCGSFAPVILAKSGTIVPTYSVTTPGHALLSLGVQKALNMPNVKSFRTKDFTAKGSVLDVPLVLLHEGGGIVETNIYSLIISSGVGGAVKLYDHVNKKEIELDPNGQFPAAAMGEPYRAKPK